MRSLLLSFAILLTGAVTVASAEPPKRTVYLDHVVLEELKKSKPADYAQATKIMAAASELCAPNAARTWQAMQVEGGSCDGMVLKMSYPPKRQIGFQIGDTRYIANVIVKDAPALLKAEPGKVIPAFESK
jgi:hypothetical protein